MTRTHRFLGGLSLGYFYLGLVTVVGLWLTPFLLGRIGTHDYGLWLITSQILGYLMLLDLGVVALVPRETAYATGRALDGASADDLARTLARFRRVVRWQLVPTAVISVVAWWLVASEWPELRLAARGDSHRRSSSRFRSGSITRRFKASRTWPTSARCSSPRGHAGTAVTIALVLAARRPRSAGRRMGRDAGDQRDGLRRPAPAAVRARVAVGGAWRVRGAQARELFARSTWVSVAQIGQVLLNGSDLLVLGALLGPAATVPYACTGKLVSVLANHPQLLMQTAAPALAEMRASASRTRLVDIALALMRAMLVISGGVACLVLTMNATFVTWWVGPSQYAGAFLTVRDGRSRCCCATSRRR